MSSDDEYFAKDVVRDALIGFSEDYYKNIGAPREWSRKNVSDCWNKFIEHLTSIYKDSELIDSIFKSTSDKIHGFVEETDDEETKGWKTMKTFKSHMDTRNLFSNKIPPETKLGEFPGAIKQEIWRLCEFAGVKVSSKTIVRSKLKNNENCELSPSGKFKLCVKNQYVCIYIEPRICDDSYSYPYRYEKFSASVIVKLKEKC